MHNFNAFRKVITKLLTTYTHSETIDDYCREMIVNVKYNNTGPVQLLYKEQLNYNNIPEFFILHMVEVQNMYHNTEFKRYLWEKDTNIKRVATISCDINNGSVIISLSEKEGNTFESSLVDKKRIIIKPNSNKGIEYTMGSEITRAVDIEDIMDAIKNKNVDKLFNGIGDYEESYQKVMRKTDKNKKKKEEL